MLKKVVFSLVVLISVGCFGIVSNAYAKTDEAIKFESDGAIKASGKTIHREPDYNGPLIITLTVGQKEADIFGTTKVSDAAPIIKNDVVMVPARFISENLSCKVLWNEDNNEVTINRMDLNISFTIGSNVANLNGESLILESPSFIDSNRSYLPLRFIAEHLGAKVDWDEKEKRITLTL